VRRIMLPLFLILSALLLGGFGQIYAAPGRPSVAHSVNSILDTNTPTPTLTPIPACGIAWRSVPSPDQGSLGGLVAVAPNDVWAGGNNGMLHWDGSAWATVPAQISVKALAAVGPNDIWAVGATIIQHWDGSAWAGVPIPLPGSAYNRLDGVTAVATNDVWAVGSYSDNGSDFPDVWVLHWNGVQWSRVTTPTPYRGRLLAVTAIAGGDIWAVGDYRSQGSGDPFQTLTMHWNGSTWAIISNPIVQEAHLFAVAAQAGNDVWAAGFGNFGDTTLIEHWNGSAWTQVPSPSPGNSFNVFGGLTVRAPNDVWAAGSASYYYNPPGLYSQTLIAHWDGSAWSRIAAPNPDAIRNTLGGITATSSGDLWAVGTTTNSSHSLILHYNDPCLTPTFIPSVTQTPTFSPTPTGTVTQTAAAGSPTTTATRSPAPSASPSASPSTTPPPTTTATDPPVTTATSSATPQPATTTTPCGIRFTDVTDPTAYYYAGVYYLACHGTISGYSDGSFRPFNQTTRGQLAKIVVLGFRLPIQTPAAGTYSFADVPPSNVFSPFVETAAASTLVSGYTCGGTNPQTGNAEPCDSAQRPYYRPANIITRAQLTKIVVIAAGWTPVSPPRQTFSDVPPSNLFYPFIETAVCHGILSGYNDGTFQPGANATRGQIAKIVTNALGSGASCGLLGTPPPLR